MPVSNAVVPWTLTMPAGSLTQWNVQFTIPTTGAPYPISSNWEYVVRPTPTDTSTPLIKVTTTPNAQGSLTVTTTATLAQVQLSLTPAATASLAPGEYSQTLWSDVGTTSAFTWLTGAFLVVGNPTP